MTDDKILDRVRKLLELAKSDNVHEAGNAAAAAQDLMSRHSISEAMLDVSPDQDEMIDSDILFAETGAQMPTWKLLLGSCIAEVNQCKAFQSGSTLQIIGKPSSAATVRYLFMYIAREIDRLCDFEARNRGAPGRTWSNNFRLGAVSEVSRRLREADAAARAAMKREAYEGDTNGTGVALMRINNALTKLDEQKLAVEVYGKTRFRLRTMKRSARYDHSARDAGKRAGATIDLSHGSGKGLGSGHRGQLGGGK